MKNSLIIIPIYNYFAFADWLLKSMKNEFNKKLNDLGINFKNPNTESIVFIEKFHDFDLDFKKDIINVIQNIENVELRKLCLKLLELPEYLDLYDNFKKIYFSHSDEKLK